MTGLHFKFTFICFVLLLLERNLGQNLAEEQQMEMTTVWSTTEETISTVADTMMITNPTESTFPESIPMKTTTEMDIQNDDVLDIQNDEAVIQAEELTTYLPTIPPTMPTTIPATMPTTIPATMPPTIPPTTQATITRATLPSPFTTPRNGICYSCVSQKTDKDNACESNPKNTIKCFESERCYILYNRHSKRIMRGCETDMSAEDKSYCAKNLKLCSVCHKDLCNNQRSPESADTEASAKRLMVHSVLLLVSCALAGFCVM